LSSWVLERPEEMPDFAVSAAEVAVPDAAGSYDVMVPVANPRTEDELIALGATLAKQNDGTIHAVHIVSVPDQTSLESVSDRLDNIDPETDTLMQGAREMAAEYDVDLETHTVVSHRPFDEIFDSARRLSADSVVMGWSERSPWTSGRTSGALESLTTSLPCDFLVFKDRGLDFSRVLLPTAGGPDSDLSAEAAKALRDVHGSEVSILHIVDEATDRAKGMSFIGDWADDHGLGDAELLVEATDDIEGAIERAAADHSLLLMGATREGLLSRLFSDSLVFDVVDDVDCSVLLSERPGKRSLRERLFGGSTEKRSAIEPEEATEDQPAEADD
ncbi:MAG: universal stress protein, partial [Halovenus sp.]